MGSFSIWHLLVVGLLFVLLFGKGKISDLMGDVAKGIKTFKKGMSEDDEPQAKPSATIDHKPEANLAQKSASKDEASKS